MNGDSRFEHEHCIPSETREGIRILGVLLEKLDAHDYPDHAIFAVRLATEEALCNAIRHGNGMDPSKRVWLRFTVNSERVTIEIADEGPGFFPEEVPDPTAPENLERPSGRGVMLMQVYMDECHFIPPGNVCRMTAFRD